MCCWQVLKSLFCYFCIFSQANFAKMRKWFSIKFSLQCENKIFFSTLHPLLLPFAPHPSFFVSYLLSEVYFSPFRGMYVKLFFFLNIFLGDFFLFSSYNIQHCFICRPSDSTVPKDAGIEPKTVATGALAVRRSKLDLIRQVKIERKCVFSLYVDFYVVQNSEVAWFTYISCTQPSFQQAFNLACKGN